MSIQSTTPSPAVFKMPGSRKRIYPVTTDQQGFVIPDRAPSAAKRFAIEARELPEKTDRAAAQASIRKFNQIWGVGPAARKHNETKRVDEDGFALPQRKPKPKNSPLDASQNPLKSRISLRTGETLNQQTIDFCALLKQKMEEHNQKKKKEPSLKEWQKLQEINAKWSANSNKHQASAKHEK